MVEIKIDTSKDSKEELKKVVDFLKSYLGEETPVSGNDFAVAPEAVSIFSDDAPKAEEPEKIEIVRDDEEEQDEEEADADDDDLGIKPIFY